MWMVSTVLGRYLTSTNFLASSNLSSAKTCLKVDTSSLGSSSSSYNPVSLIFLVKKSTVSFALVSASSFSEMYCSKSAFDSLLRSSTVMLSYSLPSLSSKRVAMDLRASLGNFLALTVLMRSGTSALLSFFMVVMNFFCWTSLKMAILLAKSSRVLIMLVLLLVKASQLTQDSSPVNPKMRSKLASISSGLISLIQQLTNYYNQIRFRQFGPLFYLFCPSAENHFIMNVHRLNDLPPDSSRRINNPQRGAPPGQPQNDNGMPWGGAAPVISMENIQFAEQNKVLLVSGHNQVKNPREENYWDMLMSSFCPSWHFISMAMLIILAQIAMFVGECIYGINKDGDLLEISYNSLIKFGASQGSKVHSGEVYRLLAAIFVHLNLVHLMGNVFSTFILVTRVEYTLGPAKTLIVYLLSGIAGNIFSLAVNSSGQDFFTVKGGASTSLHGMIGLILGYIIINWSGLELVGDGLRCTLLCMFFFLLLFVLIFTPFGTNIDYYGHLGGFLAGIWLAAIHQSLIDQKRQRIIRGVFGCLFAMQMAGCFVGFYLSH